MFLKDLKNNREQCGQFGDRGGMWCSVILWTTHPNQAWTNKRADDCNMQQMEQVREKDRKKGNISMNSQWL